MKKVLLIVAFLFILVAIPLTVFLARQRQEIRQRAAPASSLYFDPPEASGTINKSVNDIFDVPIKIDTGVNTVAGISTVFTYDPQFLEFQNYTIGSNFQQLEAKTDTAGVVDISVTTGSSNPSGINGSGITVMTIQFKAVADTGSTGTALAFGTGTVASAFGETQDVLVTKQNGRVVIGATTGASPTPSASALASASPGGASPSPSASASPGAGASPSPSTSPGTGGTGSPTPSPSSTTASPTPSASATLASPSPSSGQTTVITSPTNGQTVTVKRPTFTGRSFANALMVLSVSNTSIASTFNADASGNWSYTPTIDLANGNYVVTVTGDNIGSGVPETATANFTVNIGGTGGSVVATPTPTPRASSSGSSSTGGSGTSTTTKGGTSSAIPVSGTSAPTFFALAAAGLLLIFGTLAVIW